MIKLDISPSTTKRRRQTKPSDRSWGRTSVRSAWQASLATHHETSQNTAGKRAPSQHHDSIRLAPVVSLTIIAVRPGRCHGHPRQAPKSRLSNRHCNRRKQLQQSPHHRVSCRPAHPPPPRGFILVVPSQEEGDAEGRKGAAPVRMGEEAEGRRTQGEDGTGRWPRGTNRRQPGADGGIAG